MNVFSVGGFDGVMSGPARRVAEEIPVPNCQPWKWTLSGDALARPTRSGRRDGLSAATCHPRLLLWSEHRSLSAPRFARRVEESDGACSVDGEPATHSKARSNERRRRGRSFRKKRREGSNYDALSSSTATRRFSRRFIGTQLRRALGQGSSARHSSRSDSSLFQRRLLGVRQLRIERVLFSFRNRRLNEIKVEQEFERVELLLGLSRLHVDNFAG